MFIKHFLFFLLLILCLLLTAQDEITSRERLLFAHLGAGHTSQRDEVFSPLVYRGTGFLVGVGYINVGNKSLHTINLNLLLSELTPALNSSSQTSLMVANLSLDFSYMRRVFPNQSWRFYLGGGQFNFTSARILDFLADEEVALDYFNSLNVTVSAHKNFGTNQLLILNLSYPLVAYVAGRMRVPKDFSEDFFENVIEDPESLPVGPILKDGDFLTINKFVDVRLSASYFYSVSNRLRIGAKYAFQYYQYPKFLTVKSGVSQYILLITYSF